MLSLGALLSQVHHEVRRVQARLSKVMVKTFRFISNYFQLSEHLQAGEHGLSIDTDVALWIEYRKYNKRPDLRQVMDVNSEL